jgi:2-polyprenyl-3-methyl-5-hydroxy-6-metoxy-1,4-benzoquinol methylase
MVEEEWQRLVETPAGRVSFQIHRRFLADYIEPGMHILEIGAGPGRFTRELADLGARITVSDLSEGQLSANRQRAETDSFADSVDDWLVLDVRDVSTFDDGSFDAVVAFGGPLSYVFDHADDALRGLLRITQPNGVVLGSVMSLLGSWRHFFASVLDLTDDENDHILLTGDLRAAQPEGHVCKLYRSSEIAQLITHSGASVLKLSASNWASLDHPDELAVLEGQPERWGKFLDHEAKACAEPGALDGGTHLLFACR